MITSPIEKTSTLMTGLIDSVHGLVEFGVRRLVVSATHGRFAGLAGTIVLDEANPANSSAEVSIDGATVGIRDDTRDDNLCSADFLDAATFATIAFKSKRAEVRGSDRASVYGTVTIPGVSQGCRT